MVALPQQRALGSAAIHAAQTLEDFQSHHKTSALLTAAWPLNQRLQAALQERYPAGEERVGCASAHIKPHFLIIFPFLSLSNLLPDAQRKVRGRQRYRSRFL